MPIAGNSPPGPALGARKSSTEESKARLANSRTLLAVVVSGLFEMESVGLEGGSIFSLVTRPRRRCSSARDSALGRALSLILEERRTMAGAGCWIS